MTDRPLRALVVDDEENISYLVASALRLDGYDTLTAGSGREALDQVSATNPDVIVLDIMLPDLDGIEVLKRLRAAGHRQPVVFLTAKDAPEDRVRGLTIGGDDYVVKPFAIEELLARVTAVLRRSGMGDRSARLVVADLEMDDDARRVTRDGHPIQLSPTEYKLLRYLMTNAGRVLSRSQILDQVWEYDFGGESSVVETFISYLRRKLDVGGPPLIHTVRGVGYTLRVEDPVGS